MERKLIVVETDEKGKETATEYNKQFIAIADRGDGIQYIKMASPMFQLQAKAYLDYYVNKEITERMGQD